MRLLLNALLSETSQGGQPAQEEGGVAFFVRNAPMFLLIMAIFYFLLLRPQGKQQKQLRLFLQHLKKGDDVVTNGGIIGRVVLVEDRAVTLDVGSGNKMRILKSQIAGAWVEKPEKEETAKAEAKR